MRGHIPGLETPHPLGAMLPGVYQGDDFAQRFTSGLDEVLAPVQCTLDNLAAYFDPRTAPEDFLAFLSWWVAIYMEQSWSVPRRRQVLLRAVEIHRRRATAGGVRDAVALVLDAPVEVQENGAAAWSQRPGSDLPGRPEPELVVRIDLPELSPLEMRRVQALVARVKPAHVPHRIELGPVGPPGSTAASDEAIAAMPTPLAEGLPTDEVRDHPEEGTQ